MFLFLFFLYRTTKAADINIAIIKMVTTTPATMPATLEVSERKKKSVNEGLKMSR